jgi:hypothetical protein
MLGIQRSQQGRKCRPSQHYREAVSFNADSTNHQKESFSRAFLKALSSTRA